MTSKLPGEGLVGPVEQSWLDDMSPWLHAGNLPALTVLPDRIVNGKAVFSADIAPLVKQISSQGFDAQFLPTPSQTFQSEYGADSLIVLSFVLNVASNAAWDSFKMLLHLIRLRVKGIRETGAEPHLTLSQGIFRYSDGCSYLWQKFSGSPESVIDAAESAVRDYMSAHPGSEHREVESTPETDQSSWTAPE
jgi:hypothetical protein